MPQQTLLVKSVLFGLIYIHKMTRYALSFVMMLLSIQAQQIGYSFSITKTLEDDLFWSRDL